MHGSWAVTNKDVSNLIHHNNVVAWIGEVGERASLLSLTHVNHNNVVVWIRGKGVGVPRA
jgi:hypothetical protein